MRVLIIESERKTADFLKKGLSDGGFTVDVIEDGENGLEAAKARDYDLIILDVTLPGRDGCSVLKELRDAGKQTLSLFLSARDSVEDRVKGLDSGADAYMIKPFVFSELLAQIHSLLRRGPFYGMPEIVRIADLQIDILQCRVMRGGHRLDLTHREFELLSFFCRRPNEVLSRSVLAKQIWDNDLKSRSNVIEVQIRRLRAKVDDPFDKKLIHTVRGKGYVLRE